MHVCIVGTGSAGWITCMWLAQNPLVTRITIVGSDEIPIIGVGESTTIHFHRFLKKILPNSHDRWRCLVSMDAAIKYGVSYEGWSSRRFLHAFVGSRVNNFFGYLLGRKPIDEDVHDYMMPIARQIYANQICPDEEIQSFSFHFDAGRLVATFRQMAAQYPHVTLKQATVVRSEQTGPNVSSLWTQDNEKITADYFISCIGQTAFNQSIFQQQYQSYSHVLLTDKALFLPLQYEDKRRQFHPYTVAKSMRYGWRWITPTWSRIGTGYVFSSQHITPEQAREELLSDIGDSSLEPRLVDFSPRRARFIFSSNLCTLGMAAGFLEPLDAPGLNILIYSLSRLDEMIACISERRDCLGLQSRLNEQAESMYDFWASFVLHQYKLCQRCDSDFWHDHKAVKFDSYDQILDNLWHIELRTSAANSRSRHVDFMSRHHQPECEPYMFYNTTAGHDRQWEVSLNLPLQKHGFPEGTPFLHHYDFMLAQHQAATALPA